VRLAQAIEADSEAGVHGKWILKIRQVAADTQTERSKGDNVAAVGGQLGDLLFVDQGADYV
jgi:hypothetical protein